MLKGDNKTADQVTEDLITQLINKYDYHVGRYKFPETVSYVYQLEVPTSNGPVPAGVRVPYSLVHKLLSDGFLAYDSREKSFRRFRKTPDENIEAAKIAQFRKNGIKDAA